MGKILKSTNIHWLIIECKKQYMNQEITKSKVHPVVIDFIFLIKGMRWLSNGFNARQKLTYPTNKILTKRISNTQQTVGKVKATEEEMCEKIQTKRESKAENWDPMGHSLRRIFSQLRDAERSVLVHDRSYKRIMNCRILGW